MASNKVTPLEATEVAKAEEVNALSKVGTETSDALEEGIASTRSEPSQAEEYSQNREPSSTAVVPSQEAEPSEEALSVAEELNAGMSLNASGAADVTHKGDAAGEQAAGPTVTNDHPKHLANGTSLLEAEDSEGLDAHGSEVSWLGNNDKLERSEEKPVASANAKPGPIRRKSLGKQTADQTGKASSDGSKTARQTPAQVGSQNRGPRPASARPSPLSKTHPQLPARRGSLSDPADGRKTPRPASAGLQRDEARRLSLNHTVAKPFNFATEKRPSKPEDPASATAADSGKTTPRLGFVPPSLKEAKIPPKPTVKQSTAPKPFNLASIKRHEEAKEKMKADLAAKATEEEQQRLFKAQPVLKAEPFKPAKGVLPTTKPSGFRFTMEDRAAKRNEFKHKLEESEQKLEEQRQQELLQKKAEEEKELLEAKQRASFRATPVKYVPPEKVWQPKKVERPAIKPVAPSLGPKGRTGSSGSTTPSESGSAGEQIEEQRPSTATGKPSPRKSMSKAKQAPPARVSPAKPASKPSSRKTSASSCEGLPVAADPPVQEPAASDAVGV